MKDFFSDIMTAYIQRVQQGVNSTIIRSFLLNLCGYSLMQKLYLVVSWVSYVGEECQIASAATTSIAGKPRGPFSDSILTPGLSLTSLFNNRQSHLFLALVTHIPTQNQRPKQPYITSNLFHPRPDADDKLILRTNSIITNNPCSWQAHKKSLDEWVVYLLRCMQCRVQAWPAKMPLHYEATEQCAAQPAPVTSHREEIGY